jgi:alanine racemase
VADVHLKVNTGMNRVGAGRDEVLVLAKEIAGRPELRLEAVWTHWGGGRRARQPFTDAADRFDEAVAEVERAGLARFAPCGQHRRWHRAPPQPLRPRAGRHRHLASARRRRSTAGSTSAPRFTLRTEVTMVKRVRAGERISYGLTHEFDRDTGVATLPIGYADGVPRRLSSVGGEAHRRPPSPHRGRRDHGSAHGRHRRRRDRGR